MAWLVLLLAVVPALIGAVCIWWGCRAGDPADTPGGLQGLERLLFRE